MSTSFATEEERKLSATAERLCRRFSLAEIRLATDDFNETHLIGKGGFGNVYKGQIDDGEEAVTVAMKRLEPNSNQGEEEFMTEIETLSKLRHVNLVSLIGYCNENREMILVYEYIPRGTLADHLYKYSRSSKTDNCSSLAWKQCLNICIGAARGIDYLHTGTSIIHRDVKSTNILLDENFTAKVSDFGLAKHLITSISKSHVSTIPKGTIGYLDPSYFTTGRLTRKSDTYAFGVVMLEVLCGRPAVDKRLGEDEMSLVIWALREISKGKADMIIASNLRDEISADCLKTFLGIAERCVDRDPKMRPTMSQVVVLLELALEQQDGKEAPQFQPFWNRVNKPSGSGATEKDEKQGDVATVPDMSIHELKGITYNFSYKRLIFNGFNGDYYGGALKSGQVAAIKKLRLNCRSLSNRDFLKQVSMVASLKHENIAHLLGYCVDGDQQFLAYEFAQNGSLHDVLHGVNGYRPVPCLSWAQRVKIAYEAAKGLDYIHQNRWGHFNITSRNVLLFDDYQAAKLTDLGRSVYYTDCCLQSRDYSVYYCPHDYFPPEYVQNAELSWRSDVYSFGLVLFELWTGAKLVDHTRPRGLQHLLPWAISKLKEDRGREIVDPRLNGNYPLKSVAEMARVAGFCVQSEAKFRPEMWKVVMALHSLLKDCSATETQRRPFNSSGMH